MTPLHTISSSEAHFADILVEVFQRAGWRVRRQVAAGDVQANLIADAGDKKYLFEIKTLSEGRRDRLIPLLSQAILQAQTLAARFPTPVLPVAVVAANRVSPSVAGAAKAFAERYAPDVGVGIIDRQGLHEFSGLNLERFDQEPDRRDGDQWASRQPPPRLFSDLNQWMLKILVGQPLSESLLTIPRATFRNASQLARAANVSVMSASRFVERLTQDGFLDPSGGRLRVARVDELLERWVSETRESAREIPARWIIKKDVRQLYQSLAEYTAGRDSDPPSKRRRVGAVSPRCGLGLFAAADALGLGFVAGVPPHLYLENLDPDVLQRLGLTLEDSAHRADFYVRIPSNAESIFRAAVSRDGVPVTDALQTWLDVSTYPARGTAQADRIRAQALQPVLGGS